MVKCCFGCGQVFWVWSSVALGVVKCCLDCGQVLLWVWSDTVLGVVKCFKVWSSVLRCGQVF